MKLNQLTGARVWITGASSGIGLEMALLAAEAGAHLCLMSSRKDALAESARLCLVRGAGSVHFEAVDLSDSGSAVSATQSMLQSEGPPTHLILNAGISQRSLAAETDLAVTRKIMDLNFFGVVAVARTVLPAMLENGGGRIGVTSSVVGVFGFPLRSAYSASKHALHGYFETLDLECRFKGIQITLALPARIRTPISMRSLKGNGHHHGVMDPGHEKGMDARACAKIYWQAVCRGRRQVVIGGKDTVMVFLRRCMPVLFRIIARMVSPV